MLTVPVGAEPVLSIGVAQGDPAYEMFKIDGAVRLTDGSIVAVVAGHLEVRKFDADGTHLWSAGRAGQGPGEFTLPVLLPTCTSDNEVVIHDRALRRITLLDAEDGKFVDDYRLETADKTPYSRIQCSTSGRMVFTTYGRGGRERAEGPYRWRMGIHFIDGEDSRLGEIRDGFLGTERVVYYQGGRPFTEGPRTWGRDPVFAVTDDGVWFGTADEAALELVDWDGTVKDRIQWEGRDLVVADQNLEAYRDAVRRRYENEGGDWRSKYERRLARDLPHLPSTFPAYADVKLIGSQVWVKEYWRPGETEQHWTGFAGDGTALGWMVLPAHLNVQQFGADGDWLLAITTDRLGVERLVLYELAREDG